MKDDMMVVLEDFYREGRLEGSLNAILVDFILEKKGSQGAEEV